MATRRGDGRISDETLARYGAAVLLGFVVVGGLLVLGSVVLGGGPDRSATPRAVTTSAAPTVSASVSPTPTAVTTSALTPASMTAFVTTYLKTVADSPPEAWIMLTPAFQDASGGYAAYSSFWGRVALATPTEIVADPVAGTVGYRVSYVYADGTTRSDRTRLTLTSTDGRLRIAGEG